MERFTSLEPSTSSSVGCAEIIITSFIKYFLDSLSGTSLDWVSLNLSPNVTFTFELRPTRAEENLTRSGLILPTNEIVEVAEEIFAAITTILREAIAIDFA